MSLTRCRVVLVETHYPGNLGSVARVMANFGLNDLVLVNPIAYPRDPQALLLATHGRPVLEQARVVADLEHALADCIYVLGTTANAGGLYRRQNVGVPALVLPPLVETLPHASAALVFGPETTGLTNAAITRCHALLTIPAEPGHHALNLAQAAAICCYELHRLWQGRSNSHIPPPAVASHADHTRLFEKLEVSLEKIHFLYGPRAGPLMHGIRHLLLKARLTHPEVKILLGLARQMTWVAEHGPSGEPASTDENHEIA